MAPAVPEYVPATQFAHSDDDDTPLFDEYVPAIQFMHCPDVDIPVALE